MTKVDLNTIVARTINNVLTAVADARFPELAGKDLNVVAQELATLEMVSNRLKAGTLSVSEVEKETPSDDDQTDTSDPVAS